LESRGRAEKLGFAARAIGWDVNDLEGVTAPPARAALFASEIAVRRMAERAIFDLQAAVESGNSRDRIVEFGRLEHLEGRSHELSREAGIVRCDRILPSTARLFSP
jgi:hypothetical protein